MNDTTLPLNQNRQRVLTPVLWIFAGILLLALPFAKTVFSDTNWITYVLAGLLVADLAVLVQQNRQALKSRTAAYGANSITTVVLVLGILGVINYLAAKHPKKLDLTKEKVNTLSDQTVKVVTGLDKPMKVVFFGKLEQREQAKRLLDRYQAINPKFQVEFIDSDKERARAEQAGIRKHGTLQLISASGKDVKIEDATEEKLTNGLIQALKDKSQTLCAVTGHGEKSFSGTGPDGYEAAKKILNNQTYQVRDISLITDSKDGKLPEYCDAVAIVGPNKDFLPQEQALLGTYLDNGGRGLIALDLNIRGEELTPGLVAFVEGYGIKASKSLIIDKVSQVFGLDAGVALVANYSKENPITKDFQTQAFFPLTRPLEVLAGGPATLNVKWLAQTTPSAIAVADLKQLAKGELKFDPNKDLKGPLNVAVTVDGKKADSKATRNTRLVVFGTSNFATNKDGRMAANFDIFGNSVSWLMEDENLISIRAKEETPGKIEISRKAMDALGWLTIAFVPLAIFVSGLGIWFRRRRL